MELLEEWLETFQEVITGPTDYLQRERRYDGFEYPLKFAAISLLLAAVLNAARVLVVGPQGGASTGLGGNALLALLTLVVSPILGMVFLGLGAGLVHLFVMLFEGSRGYKETLAAFEYATALSPVSALVSFVPLVGGLLNFVLGIYGIYIQVRGLESFQDLSTGKAVVAVVAPAVIILLLFVVVAVVAGAAFFSSALGA